MDFAEIKKNYVETGITGRVPMYAPEVKADDSTSFTYKSDIWMLGVLFYNIIIGKTIDGGSTH